MAAGCTVEVPFFFLAGHWLINKLQVLTFKKDRNFIKDFNSTIKKLFSKWARATTGFYTKLIVWGSLGLNFEYDGGPIIEIGGPIFLHKLPLPEDRKKQSLI